MCICIYKEANKILTKEELQIADAQNPHGAGFAYSSNGELIVKKGYVDFESFWNDFNEIQDGNPAIVHFRIATSGLKDEQNCHPWLINEDVCIIHNGILEDFTDKNSKMSDTGLFVEHVLKPLFELAGPKAYQIGYIKYLISKAIGSNKIIFFDKDGEFFIFNDNLGYWEDNCKVWYSNTSCKVESRVVVTVCKSESKYARNNKPKYGYIKVGCGMRILSSQEIGQLCKQYGTKTKKLVRKGILARVEIEDDESSELEQWLADKAMFS